MVVEYHNGSNGVGLLFEAPALAFPAACRGLSPSIHSYPQALHPEGFIVSPAAFSFHEGPQAGIKAGHDITNIVFSELDKNMEWSDYRELLGNSCQEKYLQEPGKDVWSRRFKILPSDPEKDALITPTMLAIHRIELFMLSTMGITNHTAERCYPDSS
jgi:hypothetical protein